MKTMKLAVPALLMMMSVVLTSCKKENADVKNPEIDPASAGKLHVENVDSTDEYQFTIEPSAGGKTVAKNVDISALQKLTYDVEGGKYYKVKYVQNEGYIIYPTKGEVEVYVGKKEEGTAKIPD